MLMTLDSEATIDRIITEAHSPVWCAVYTSIGCELAVQERVEKLGYGTCCLRFNRLVGWRRKRWEPTELTPRYVLFRRPRGDDDWTMINDLPGVERVLVNNGEPIAFSGSDLIELRRLMIECAMGEHDSKVVATRRKYLKYQKRRQRPRRGRTVRKVRAALERARAG